MQVIQVVIASVASVVLSACQQIAPVFTDANPVWRDYGFLIEQAPIVVIARSGGKVPLGKPGIIDRPEGLGPVHAQRYTCELSILKSLRDTVAAGARIKMNGYLYENIGISGPPTGICGEAGTKGVYFLRREGDGFRPLADVWQTWVPLDSGTDISLASADDISLSIWKLLLNPYETGIRPVQSIDFSFAAQAVGYQLGRARLIELLSALANNSGNPNLRTAACIYLNRTNWGCGKEGCMITILNDRSNPPDEAQKAELQSMLEMVPASNAKLMAALKENGTEEISWWAHSHDPEEVRSFLRLLMKHPDRQIARLAQHRLTTISEKKGPL